MINLHVTIPEDDAYWQRVFADSLTNGDNWIQSAKSIRLVVDLIAQPLSQAWRSIFESSIGGRAFNHHPAEIKMHPVLLMLSSYAAENYLKAQIVKVKGFTSDTIENNIPGDLKGHNITQLAKKAGAVLNDEEADLADRLSVYATWAGRYPAPVSKDQLKPQQVSDKKIRAMFFRGRDIAVAQCLLQKLEELTISGVMPNLQRRGNIYDMIIIQERVYPW
jgi:hypothetical protein